MKKILLSTMIISLSAGFLFGCASTPEKAPAATPAAAPAPAKSDSAAVNSAAVPDVLNIVMQKKDMKSDIAEISAEYPKTGIASIDTAVEQYVDKTLAENEKMFKDEIGEDPDLGSRNLYFSLKITADRNKDGQLDLYAEHRSYMGGAHDGLALGTIRFDTKTGKQIKALELFKNPEKALQVMSQKSNDILVKQLDNENINDMIKEGTAPKAENFENIVRTDTGIKIYFQPYQVGPWVIGTQVVELPWTDFE